MYSPMTDIIMDLTGLYADEAWLHEKNQYITEKPHQTSFFPASSSNKCIH